MDRAKQTTDPFDNILAAEESTKNIWETTDGEMFAVTNNSVYLPGGVGPVEDEEVKTKDLDTYTIEFQETDNSKKRLKILPLLSLGAICFGIMLIAPTALGLLLMLISISTVLISVLLYIHQESKETGVTYVTLEMGRFSNTLEIKGNHENEISTAVGNAFSN